MNPELTTEQTTTHHPPEASSAGEGVALALRAEEAGQWGTVIDWLARHPEHAAELAQFLAGSREVREAFGTAMVPGPMAAPGLEIKERIGQGAMGVVHRARQSGMGRDVAVKFLRVPGLTPAERARFQFEAEAHASLDHPNVVGVHAAGEADGNPYLVMP